MLRSAHLWVVLLISAATFSAWAGPPPARPTGAPSVHGKAAPAAPASAERQALMQAQMRVMQAQQKALADPGIQAEMQALQQAVEAEMIRLDASLAPKVKRFHALEDQLKNLTAEQKQDTNLMRSLMTEVQSLGMELSKYEGQVMANAALKQRVDAFQSKIEKKMAEFEPDLQQLIAQLQSAAPGAAPAPPPMAP